MLLERMYRINNTHINKVESLNFSIEAITMTVVANDTQDTNMYECHYEEGKVEVPQEE